MKERLEKELADLPDNFIILTLLPPNKYSDVNLHFLDLFINKNNHRGTYITVNRPYKSLVSMLNKSKIDHNRLFFIDCITGEVSGEEKAANCVFLDSPSSLTDLEIAIDEVLKRKEHNFILLDSLDTLSFYNDINSVVKFAHILTSKIRLNNINGVMITLHEDTDKRLINELARFCDKVIDLTK
ncbi:hypothetical protein HYX19_00925 [Candidatus Woesearchaeota archaeon]|nr:hypothetical protein [Candidatus Woesearchaeota archaeon]